MLERLLRQYARESATCASFQSGSARARSCLPRGVSALRPRIAFVSAPPILATNSRRISGSKIARQRRAVHHQRFGQPRTAAQMAPAPARRAR